MEVIFVSGTRVTVLPNFFRQVTTMMNNAITAATICAGLMTVLAMAPAAQARFDRVGANHLVAMHVLVHKRKAHSKHARCAKAHPGKGQQLKIFGCVGTWGNTGDTMGGLSGWSR